MVRRFASCHVAGHDERAGTWTGIGSGHSDAVHHGFGVHHNRSVAVALAAAAGHGNGVVSGGFRGHGNGGRGVIRAPVVGVTGHIGHGECGGVASADGIQATDFGHRGVEHRDGVLVLHITVARHAGGGKGYVIGVGRGGTDGSGVPSARNTVVRAGQSESRAIAQLVRNGVECRNHTVVLPNSVEVHHRVGGMCQIHHHLFVGKGIHRARRRSGPTEEGMTGVGERVEGKGLLHVVGECLVVHSAGGVIGVLVEAHRILDGFPHGVEVIVGSQVPCSHIVCPIGGVGVVCMLTVGKESLLYGTPVQEVCSVGINGVRHRITVGNAHLVPALEGVAFARLRNGDVNGFVDEGSVGGVVLHGIARAGLIVAEPDNEGMVVHMAFHLGTQTQHIAGVVLRGTRHHNGIDFHTGLRSVHRERAAGIGVELGVHKSVQSVVPALYDPVNKDHSVANHIGAGH